VIERQVFNAWMAVLADRFNRPFEAPTIKVWYAILTQELSTTEFETAAAVAFRQCPYWPSPKELIEFVRPQCDHRSEAAEKFRELQELAETTTPGVRFWRADVIEANLGSLALSAFRRIGGNERLRNLDAGDFQYARRDFIEMYATSAAQLEKTARAKQAFAMVTAVPLFRSAPGPVAPLNPRELPQISAPTP
jgi:hypothetical protein